ncbi:hypothetical protein CDAR_487741 [Caerostris darwini]|uniref:Maturase K n=1 Tax=Caerostris darwini TaxID=1538125 RepID=A0AAV4PUQ9_9ARAC|nr:hypothetical protein CDAR_487741 [Caerostris darwini]
MDQDQSIFFQPKHSPDRTSYSGQHHLLLYLHHLPYFSRTSLERDTLKRSHVWSTLRGKIYNKTNLQPAKKTSIVYASHLSAASYRIDEFWPSLLFFFFIFWLSFSLSLPARKIRNCLREASRYWNIFDDFFFRWKPAQFLQNCNSNLQTSPKTLPKFTFPNHLNM